MLSISASADTGPVIQADGAFVRGPYTPNGAHPGYQEETLVQRVD